MRFQLVLQFPAGDIQAFDEFVILEDDLARSLGQDAEVDGHDLGSGELNIFVVTDQPRQTFETVQRVMGGRHAKQLKAAYREVGDEEFVVLWPRNLLKFNVA